MEISGYIDDLFRYLEAFETNTTQFETEAFLQTYNGIIAVFGALREQRDRAVEVDQALLEKMKLAPLTTSDLRQTTVQVLVSFFEAEVDVDGRSDRSYSYCRGVRPVKQDVPFIVNHLVPGLFRTGALQNNTRLNHFLLDEMARFMSKFGKPVDSAMTPETWQQLSDPLKVFELARRRRDLGDDLIHDRTSLEFHLNRVNLINRLAERSKLIDGYLSSWGYVQRETFWSKLSKSLGAVFGKLRGTFSSSTHFRLTMTQRRPAILIYLVVMILAVAFAIWVPGYWSNHTEQRLEEFRSESGLAPLDGGETP